MKNSVVGVEITTTINIMHVLCFPIVPSVLWRCWLGGRKGIRPVKKLSGGVLAWSSVWSEVQTCIWPSWCHCHSLSLASVKSRLVLPFWYRLTWVVPEKEPLKGCSVFPYIYPRSRILQRFMHHSIKVITWLLIFSQFGLFYYIHKA